MNRHPEARTSRVPAGDQQTRGTPAQGDLMDKAKSAATAAGEKADAAASAVGEGMTSLAHSIREKAPHEGMLGSASGSVASGLERGGQYLRQEGFRGMMNDLTDLVRNNPLPAVLIGVGVGFMLAQARRK